MEIKEPARTFRDLIVWQKAHKLVLEAYRLTAKFPEAELYGLTSQLRRSAVSIPANIAEGFKKRGKDKSRYFSIALSSLEESRYYLILANDLGYGATTMVMDQLEEVSKLLVSYSNTIRSS